MPHQQITLRVIYDLLQTVRSYTVLCWGFDTKLDDCWRQ